MPPLVSRTWPYALVGLAVIGVGVAAWRPVPAGVWHDDGVYMLVGKAIAGGHGLTYDGVVGAPPAAKFPPVYPGLLAVLWLALGSIGPVTFAATVLNLGFLGAAAALFTRALRDAGLRLAVGAGVAGLAFVSADLLRAALLPLSESLFLLIASAALALWNRAAEEDGRAARLGIAALLLAATLWGWRSSVMTAALPEGTRDLLGSYGSWLVDQTVAAPIAFLSGLPSHAVGVLERAASVALPGLEGAVLFAAALPVAAVAVIGLSRASRAFPPLFWLVPAYLGMLLLWPYLDRRLVTPLHPFLIGVLALGAAALLERHRGRRMRTAWIVLCVAWVGLYSVVTATRIATDWPVGAYRIRAEHLAAAIESLERTAPEDAIVGAPEFWAALHLHGGWTVAPSVRFDPRSVDPQAPMWGTPEEQLSLWRTTGIDHLLLEQNGALHGATLDRLEDACPGTVFLLAQAPPLILVRLDRAGGCGLLADPAAAPPGG